MYHINDEYSLPLSPLEETNFPPEISKITKSCAVWFDEQRESLPEISVIRDYTSFAYRDINYDLRQFFTRKCELADQTSCMLDMINFLPTFSGILYRGVPNKRGIEYKIGEKYSWDMFVSCSVTPQIAANFSQSGDKDKRVIFRILNAYGYVIDTLSAYRGEENEVLLMPGSITVVAIYKRSIQGSPNEHTFIDCVIDPLPIGLPIKGKYNDQHKQ